MKPAQKPKIQFTSFHFLCLGHEFGIATERMRLQMQVDILSFLCSGGWHQSCRACKELRCPEGAQSASTAPFFKVASWDSSCISSSRPPERCCLWFSGHVQLCGAPRVEQSAHFFYFYLSRGRGLIDPQINAGSVIACSQIQGREEPATDGEAPSEPWSQHRGVSLRLHKEAGQTKSTEKLQQAL